MTLNCLGRAVRYPLATGHPSGWPGGFSKVCPGGSTFGLSLPLSFRFTGPLGLSSAFGASWSCFLDGGGGRHGGAIAEETLALRNPWLDGSCCRNTEEAEATKSDLPKRVSIIA